MKGLKMKKGDKLKSKKDYTNRKEYLVFKKDRLYTISDIENLGKYTIYHMKSDTGFIREFVSYDLDKFFHTEK